jgi:hypothetical protein
MRTLGLHLVQSIGLIESPRRSILVEINQERTYTSSAPPATIDEIVAAIGRDPALLVVDAPLVVPNARGQRDLERILAWCDVPAFPVSQTRLEKVHGGVRGVELAGALPAAISPIETHPDLALRLLMWEAATGGVPIDLADFRSAWLGIRAPTYRPRGPGRAHPEGIIAVASLLARNIDLGGWTPGVADDDWGPIRDAAVLDAIVCASVAHRAIHSDGTLIVGDPKRGQMLVPVDANLRNRLQATVARLTADGTIPAAG